MVSGSMQDVGGLVQILFITGPGVTGENTTDVYHFPPVHITGGVHYGVFTP